LIPLILFNGTKKIYFSVFNKESKMTELKTRSLEDFKDLYKELTPIIQLPCGDLIQVIAIDSNLIMLNNEIEELCNLLNKEIKAEGVDLAYPTYWSGETVWANESMIVATIVWMYG
jgi:hypothetical protein